MLDGLRKRGKPSLETLTVPSHPTLSMYTVQIWFTLVKPLYYNYRRSSASQDRGLNANIAEPMKNCPAASSAYLFR